jgi:predicted ATPase
VAVNFGGHLRVLRREPPAARELAEELITLSNQYGFLATVAIGTCILGWSRAAQGRVEEGMRMMAEGLDGLWATGFEIYRSMLFALLADVCRQAGRAEQGLAHLAEAWAVAERSGERFMVADLHRLHGELLLLQDPADPEIEERFQEALAVARRQGARALELRAAISLGRLWRRRDRHSAARDLLAEVTGGFTEGLGTADLKEAQALLAELS